MRELIYHDLVIGCSECNLRCKYCISVEEGQRLDNSHGNKNVIDIDKITYILNRINEIVPAPILKISGGELFLFENILDLVDQLVILYPHIQILTNGTLLNQEKIDHLSKYKNININFSLDGHILSMNLHRYKSQKIHEDLLGNIKYALSKMDNIEITSVISDINSNMYGEFLDYLCRLEGNIVAFPIPIRGNAVNHMFSIEKRNFFASKIVEWAKKYHMVTGPIVYYKKLSEFLSDNKISRTMPCAIPKATIQLFDDGSIKPCPVVWTNSIGNMIDDSLETLSKNIQSHKIYEILTHKTHKLNLCKDCFTQTEVINLFLNQELSICELRLLPMYSSERAVDVVTRFGGSFV